MPERSLSRGYIAALAGAAVVVLIVGVLLRRFQRAPEPVVPPSEASRLEELSRVANVRALAANVGQWVAGVGRYAQFVPAAGVSGISWTKPGQVLIPEASPLGGSWPLRLAELAESGAAGPVRGAGDALAGGWVVLVVRGPGGEIRSAVAWLGGKTQARCGGAATPTLTLATTLGPGWLGAGVFDVQNALLGIVARCDEGYAAISADALDAVLARARSPGARVALRLGIELESPDSALRARLDADTGLVVAAVWGGTAAAAAGLSPGDVVVAIGGVPADVATLAAASDSAAEIRLTLTRPGGRRGVTLERGGALAATVSDGGLVLDAVPPGSPADRAGLRPGDRIVAVDRQAVAAAGRTAAVERALRGPAYVVFRRGAVIRGVLVLP